MVAFQPSAKLQRGLKMLGIAALVLLLHGVLVLSLRLSASPTLPATAVVMAVEMIQLAPVLEPAQKVVQSAPKPEPEPVKPVDKVPPPVVEKAAISLPKVEKLKVHSTRVNKPKPQPETQPFSHTPVPVSMKAPPVNQAVTPPVFNAAYLNNPPPDYPRLSRKLREQGTVILSVQVSTSGQAEAVSVNRSSGFERLDQVAVIAVKRWRFVAAKQGDQPVVARVIVPLVFSLGD